MSKIKIYNMKMFQTCSINNHYVLRVPGGWIFTDRRGNNPDSVFVPFCIESPNDPNAFVLEEQQNA